MKTLYILTSGISQKVPIKPYEQHDADNVYSVDSYQGLCQSGFCESLLFADFCKRKNLIFDEIHYECNTCTNMAPQQMAVILKKLGIISDVTTHWSHGTVHWTNNLDSYLSSESSYPNINHPECNVIQHNANNVLWIVNPAKIRKLRKSGFSPRTMEGYMLQSNEWKNIFQNCISENIIQSELLRNPLEIEQYNVWHKIKNENPEFMDSVKKTDLMEKEAKTVIGNEKLFNMKKQDLEQLLGLLKKSYDWNIQK